MGLGEAESSTLRKHVGTVHISAPLTLLQRKAFNVLLFNAFPHLSEIETHEISIGVLAELMGFNSKNSRRLKELIEPLVTSKIQWFGETDDNWGVCTFLSGIEFREGRCRYSYSPFLAEQLTSPEVYAKIDIGSLKHFTSKYSLALYENCARYAESATYVGVTPQWPIAKFRALMGIANPSSYKTFKALNARVVKPAVKEVNKYSEIVVQPRFSKSGKWVTSVSFAVRTNPQFLMKFLSKEEEAEEAVMQALNDPLIKRMADRYGVPPLLALNWLNSVGSERFLEVLDNVDRAVATGRVKRPVGFIRAAFEQEYEFTSATAGVNPAQQQAKQEAAERLLLENSNIAARERDEKAVAEHLALLSPSETQALEEAFVAERVTGNPVLEQMHRKSGLGELQKLYEAFVLERLDV